MNNNDIVGVDQIFHEGDTNTYMQFHAADQWRVVTGGTERLEVNNSAVKVTGNMIITGTLTGGFPSVATPTLTSPAPNQIKLTNRSSYGSPSYRVKRGSSNLLYTEDSEGVLTITGGTTATGNQTISVQVFDFGGTSSTATVTVTLAAAYRYYRLTSFSPVGTAGYMTQFRLNSGLNGTSPIVISDANFSASFSYSGYPPANANNATQQGWWPLGHSGATYTADWIKIDAGSSIVVASLFLQWYPSYWSANATLQGSDDGSSWTTMKTITGMTAGSSNTVNI